MVKVVIELKVYSMLINMFWLYLANKSEYNEILYTYQYLVELAYVSTSVYCTGTLVL